MRYTPPKPATDQLLMVDRLAGYFREHPPRNRAEMREGTRLVTRKKGKEERSDRLAH